MSRKQPNAYPTTSTAGRDTRVGLVALGDSYVTLRNGIGRVVGWRRPHFVVEDPDGRRLLLRAQSVAESLWFPSEAFYDPRLFTFDWATFRPYLTPGWRRGLFSFAARFRATVPRAWLDPDDPAGGAPPALPPEGASADEFRAHRQTFLRFALSQLADNARATTTVRGLKNAGLKLLWFLATMDATLPPSQGHYADYLAYLATERGALGCITQASGAIRHLCRVNNWPVDPYITGIALLPSSAVARATRHQVKKVVALRLVYVRGIADMFCFARRGIPTAAQWEFAIGVGIVVSFCVFARWSDAAVLRWDEGFFEEDEQYVRFFLEHRKNAQFAGNFVDIARPADSHHRGAYHMVREAKALFRRGHVLPHISASGVVDHSRYMPYASYVLHLRRALVRVGVPVEEALKFAGQSARAGAATEAVQAGLPPHTLCRMAGVSTISWCLGYVRPDQEDRLRESRKIGL